MLPDTALQFWHKSPRHPAHILCRSMMKNAPAHGLRLNAKVDLTYVWVKSLHVSLGLRYINIVIQTKGTSRKHCNVIVKPIIYPDQYVSLHDYATISLSVCNVLSREIRSARKQCNCDSDSYIIGCELGLQGAPIFLTPILDLGIAS